MELLLGRSRKPLWQSGKLLGNLWNACKICSQRNLGGGWGTSGEVQGLSCKFSRDRRRYPVTMLRYHLGKQFCDNFIGNQEKRVLAKGVSAESKETENNQGCWSQQYMCHSQERRTFLQKPPASLKNPFSWLPIFGHLFISRAISPSFCTLIRAPFRCERRSCVTTKTR